MSYDPNNIFACILRKEILCDAVYEDEFVLAFHDLHPKAPVHLLVIPKGQFINFDDFVMNAKSEHLSHFYRTVGKLCHEYNLIETGYRVIANAGINGGQEVPHFHVHLLGGIKLSPMC